MSIAKKNMSDETKKKLSNAQKGKKASDEAKQKMSEASRRKGISQETRLKMNESLKRSVLCIETKQVFKSIKEAASFLNISGGHISDTCKGKRQTCGEYHWRYLDSIEADEEISNRIELKKGYKTKPKLVKCIETGIIYPSMAEACRDLKEKYTYELSQVFHNKRETAYGFHWEFLSSS